MTHAPASATPRWHGHRDSAAVEQAVTRIILDAAHTTIAQHGAFHLVLAGGTTPRRIYERLRLAPADWAHWHIYFGDERCLPADHPDRNSHMAHEAWLSQVAIPAPQIHPIPAELGAQTAATAYAETLSTITVFDMVLLGLGEDGHTASLFPGHPWGEDRHAAATLAVFNAPKPPAYRVSLSAHRLSLTKACLYIVTGASKRSAVHAWRHGESIPAAAIQPIGGVGVDIHGDMAAMAD
ncbi:MAG: 6-phosphogluconolactonase [Betaproteobacteria bacterium]|nr:MAG: 6-phosphogluconolactonase [Betaproteobacteria bacterium]